MFKSIRSLLLLLVFAVAIFSARSQSVHAQNIEDIVILDIDTSQFPDITIKFRAVDTTGKVPTELTHDDIDVYEYGQLVDTEIVVTKGEVSPGYVFFVIDRGYYTNFSAYDHSTLQQSISRFLDGEHFRDGVDTVAIYARVNDVQIPAADSSSTPVPGSPGNDKGLTIMAPTKSASVFDSAIRGLDFSWTNGATRGLLGVDDARAEIDNRTDPEKTSTAVVLLSSLIQSPGALTEARRLGEQALAEQVAIYSLHAHSNGQFADPLQMVAEESGGDYLLLSTEAERNVSDLNDIYKNIIAQGQTYTVQYRSTRGDSGARTVGVGIAGEPYDSAAKKTVDVNIQSPIIEIISPRDDITVERRVVDLEEDVLSYEPDSLTVTAEVTWPDEYPREIDSVEFFVNGLSELNKENPKEDQTQFELDLTGIDQSKPLSVLARVKDKLGTGSESEAITINVEVEDIVPAQVPGPEVTRIIETKVEVPVPAVDPCVENPYSLECVPRYIPWVVSAALFVLLILVLILYRRQVAAFAGGAGQAIRERVDVVRQTLLGGGNVRGKTVLAKLHVLNARRDLVDGEIKIYTNTTTIGRDPKLCDIQLYDEDDASSVSGQHCTITYDKGTFNITDDNSSVGTEINGNIIPPNDPIILNDGDEIVLGDLFRRGAKLRLEIVHAPEDEDPLGGSEEEGSGRTTIIDNEAGHDWGPLDTFAQEDPDISDDDSWLNDLE